MITEYDEKVSVETPQVNLSKRKITVIEQPGKI
jgi:hypothetical protein